MPQPVGCTDAQLRPHLQQASKQIHRHAISLRHDHSQILGCIHWPCRGVISVEARDARPAQLRGGSQDREDPAQLVLVGRAGEEGVAGQHLGHDAAYRPHVDAGAVHVVPEEHIRGSVPERDDIARVAAHGEAIVAGEAEVRNPELLPAVYQQVLGLQVSVKHKLAVAERDASHKLICEGLERLQVT